MAKKTHHQQSTIRKNATKRKLVFPKTYDLPNILTCFIITPHSKIYFS